VLSWSHQGRISSEAAFARLAGVAPIPASSGQTVRYRLDRSGDRKLNRTAHDPRHTQALTPRHDRLHRTAHPRGQDPTRSNPLPQTLPRPESVPATRTGSTPGDLTNIEASLAHSSHCWSFFQTPEQGVPMPVGPRPQDSGRSASHGVFLAAGSRAKDGSDRMFVAVRTRSGVAAAPTLC
jgi:transposase